MTPHAAPRSLLLLCGIFASLAATEAEDKYPDGTTAAKYEVDSHGAKSGSYSSFYPDGKPKEKGSYRKDLKQGRWTVFDDDAKGRIHCQESFDKGRLSGTYIENRAGKLRLKALYAKGELASPIGVFATSGALERQLVYPHALDALTMVLGTLLTPAGGEVFTDKPSTAAPFKAGTVAKPVQEQALHALQALRLLCGAPWQDLALDPAASDLVQHAAVQAAAKGFSHEPSQPDGMAADFFAAAVEGTKSCLYWSNPGDDALVRSLWNWANDPDANVSHRRFLLNPTMARVGFGFVPPHTLIDVMDTSGGQGAAWDFISFPGQGYFPRALVGKDVRWSIHPNLSRIPRLSASSIAVTIHHLDDDDAIAAPVQVSDLHVDTDASHPLAPAVVFVAHLDPGPQRLWVEVASGGSETPVLSYVVDLVDIVLPAPSALLPQR